MEKYLALCVSQLHYAERTVQLFFWQVIRRPVTDAELFNDNNIL